MMKGHMREILLTLIEVEVGHPVTEETTLDDLGTDSLEFINLTLMLSNEAGKSIPDDRLPELKTVGDLVREYCA